MSGLAILVVLTSALGQAPQDLRLNTSVQGKHIIVEVRDQFGNAVAGANVEVWNRDKTRPIVRDIPPSDPNGKTSFMIPEPAYPDYYVVIVTKNNFRRGETEIRWKIDDSFPVQLVPKRQIAQTPNVSCEPCYVSCYAPCYISCYAPCYWPCYAPCVPCYPSCDPCGVELCAEPFLCARSTERGGAIAGNSGNARLEIAVPQDAVVFINGHRTTSKGTTRTYVSLGLAAGREYKYVVRAQISRNGRVIEDTRELILRAKDSRSVALDFSNRGNLEYAYAY